jgi:hypothetical protein
MEFVRQIVVFDAADIDVESAFWAGMLGGTAAVEEAGVWHTVFDADGTPRISVQSAPDHVPPEWPHGAPQQIHLDFHVADPAGAHEEVIALGARLLYEEPFTNTDGFNVYADPAGHPFCLCWGQPSDHELRRRYLGEQPPQG